VSFIDRSEPVQPRDLVRIVGIPKDGRVGDLGGINSGPEVGAVTLGIEVCGTGVEATGTFSIATVVGTLSGNVSGSLASDFELTVVSGTGAFATTTGTLHVSNIQELPGGSYRAIPITGLVTIP
jgi:hypothetical protein